MSKEKYLFNQNQSIMYFDNKNDFINFCQTRYNDSFNSRRKYDFSFSYDYGQNWYHINDFKSLRQIIQNEKNVSHSRDRSSANKKSYNKGENAKIGNGFSIMQILAITILLWIGLSFFNKKIIEINFINKINGRLFGWNSGMVRNGSLKETVTQTENISVTEPPFEENSNQTISISDDAIQIYNSSKFIEALAPDASDKNDILLFLTKSKNYFTNDMINDCDSHGIPCHYCNKILSGKSIPIYEYVLNEYIQNAVKGNMILILGKTISKQQQNQANSESEDPEKVDWSNLLGESMNDEIKSEVNKFYTYIRSNSEYVCVPTQFEESIGKKFCSKKCLNEYRIYN